MEMESSKNQVTSGSHVLQYDDQFPPLPMSSMPKPVQNSKPRSNPVHVQSKSSNVTQTLVVPLAERRFATREGVPHNDAQKKICQNVAQKCGVSIELNAGLKDQNLSVFISGTLEKVVNAKKILAKELQTQTQLQLSVPKEYHKFILGRNGASLREIENNSSTNITIPRTNEDSDIVSIFGTKEGIEKARYDINQIVTERSKLATERITIPRRFYPFINGPNNSNINRIRDATNAKINIPPTQAESEEIIISGEKEGVFEALAIIQKQYNDIKRNSSSLNLPIPKSQHRYVIGSKGSGLTEILEKTGISVEMPSQDSDDDTIVLFGPNEHLAPALSLVIQKSESMLCVTLEAPQWLHRFIIGKNGSNLNKMLENYERVFVNFQDDSESIVIEGAKDDVLELKSIIEEKIDELKRTMAIAELQVDPRFHRHIIGRSGANIQRMQEDFKVQIRMPGQQSSWTIKIEGDPEGVKECKAEIESMSIKLENEKTKDVVVDHRYHNQLIGAQGANVKELRALFPEVTIAFPETSLKSDIVQLRGPRQQVDQLFIKFNKLIAEVVENNHVKEVRILKQFHKNIIGKGGANIRKIREESNVRIDFPGEQSDSDVVRITGKKKNVQEAAKKIEAIQSELVSIKEVTINVPHKLHTSLIGVRGKIIKCLQEDCGGVIIQFPSSESGSDAINIRGAEADVEKASKMLQQLAEKNQLLMYEETVPVKAEYHGFLIGRKGTAMAEFRKKHAVMVVFPDSEDVNKDEIVIVGAKEAVQKARQELESTVRSLEDEVEDVVAVEPRWHKAFFARRQALMEEIARECGGARLYFPKMDATENCDQVRVVGPRGCVQAAIARVKDIVENLEAQTTVVVAVEQKHHRVLLSRHMPEIKAIQTEYDVAIKFPAKDTATNEEADVVMISGRKERCEDAREALLELVPVSEEVPLPNELHRSLIGQKGQGVNAFSAKHNVSVTIPQAGEAADHIVVRGTRAAIADAKVDLAEMVDQWEQDKLDRAARNFELAVEVPIGFHRNIIGQRGANIDLFKSQFNVQVQVPEQNSGRATIIIRGYEEDAQKAAEELAARVARLEAQVREELHIPREVHPLLIGTRGINLKKLREQFKVEVNFPNRDAEGDKAQLVEVVGDKDNVDLCCDHLIERANELLEELEERSQFRGTQDQPQSQQQSRGNNHRSNGTPSNGSGFMLTGAPWQQRVPDAHSNDDFPTMLEVTGGATVVNGHSE